MLTGILFCAISTGPVQNIAIFHFLKNCDAADLVEMGHIYMPVVFYLYKEQLQVSRYCLFGFEEQYRSAFNPLNITSIYYLTSGSRPLKVHVVTASLENSNRLLWLENEELV